MSWIDNLKKEVAGLDTSPKSLRKFGLTVGGVFLLLAALGFWKDWADGAKWSFLIVGAFLMLFGLIAPIILKFVYIAWMTIAFAIGGVVSKVILTIIFFIAIVPMGIIGRLFKLPFNAVRSPEAAESYWVERKPVSKTHYEKLF